jgi:glycosyltransferase involved in cell wall biosynthesis
MATWKLPVVPNATDSHDLPPTTPRARARTLVIWHGYLLGATGSNIYTHHLVDSWVRAGHDVVLACQDRDPHRHPAIQEAVWLRQDPASGLVEVDRREFVREQCEGEGRCTMVVPDLGGVLPVYVLDRYEGFEVVRVPGLEPARLEAYLARHAGAMQWVLDSLGPVDGVLVNHASPLPQALAPVLGTAGVPFAVKVHGSELEYALAEDPSLVEPAADALARASSVLVGSGHIERRTRELLGDAAVDGRVATVPPGVDLERFAPIAGDPGQRRATHAQLVVELRERAGREQAGRGAEQAGEVARLVAEVDGSPERAAGLVDALGGLLGSYAERQVERTAVAAVEAIDPDRSRVLVYVGKLIPQKGVHLLLAALPALLEREPEAHLVVAGFGPLRDGLEAMLAAMDRGDLASLEALADGMGRLSGEGGSGLVHLRAFLDARRAAGTLDAWLDLCRRTEVGAHVTWLGLVDHGVLARLWPLAEASVVPSVLAEAFGMVAAEAAACGCVPVVADHSGLAFAASVIERDGVAPIRVDMAEPAAAVDALAAVLVARFELDAPERARQAAAARANVAAAWSWDSLAEEVATLMCTPHPQIA